jgi:hypothetical protein
MDVVFAGRRGVRDREPGRVSSDEAIEAQRVPADQMIDKIEAFVAGTPRNLVVG